MVTTPTFCVVKLILTNHRAESGAHPESYYYFFFFFYEKTWNGKGIEVLCSRAIKRYWQRIAESSHASLAQSLSLSSGGSFLK